MMNRMPNSENEADAAPAKPSSVCRRWVKRIMIYLIAIYLIWLVVAFTIQRSILFPRSLIDVPASAAVTPETEFLHIETSQGQVEGWFIPGQGVSDQAPGPLVIFSHGNGELIDHWPILLHDYYRMGVSVLLPEFRGYGRSAGDPSQRAIEQDYVAFYDRVTKRPDVDASRVVFHGRSIGGAVVIQLAKDRKPNAIILQSAPASIRRMAARLLVPWFLVRDPYYGVPIVEQYDGLVLVMHGKQDRIISPGNATRLANAATNPQSRLIWYDVDHNTLPSPKIYWKDIQQFLNDAGILE